MEDIIPIIVDNIKFKNGYIQICPYLKRQKSLMLEDSKVAEIQTISTMAEYLYANYYAFFPKMFQGIFRNKMKYLGRRISNLEFLNNLIKANPGTGYLSEGWRLVQRNDNGDFQVEKNGIFLLAIVGKHFPAENNYKIGEEIAIRFPNESIYALPSFYVMFGNAGPNQNSDCTRFYLNLVPEHAANFVNCLLTELLKLHIPYSLKIINNPNLFDRRDNTILYISKSEYTTVAEVILSVAVQQSHALQNDVPGLTLPLSRGIAVADNPFNVSENLMIPMSFGQHRMELIANALSTTISKGNKIKSKIFEDVRNNLFESGIDPDRPYLNDKHSIDYYHIK